MQNKRMPIGLWLKRIVLGIIVFTGLIFIILFIVDGTYLSKIYLQPWQKSYHRQFDDPRIRVIAHGLLAPNAHNMQPWKIILSNYNNQEFKLFVETRRLLPETDPFSRQIVISQGTFLEMVRIAARELGYHARIVLFPEGEFDEQGSVSRMNAYPVARVILEKTRPVEEPLYNTIFERVTNRTPYLHEPLRQSQIEMLQNLNSDSTITVEIVQKKEDLEKLMVLAQRGVRVESTLPSTLQETEQVLRMNERQKNEFRYGITLDSQGNTGIKKFLIQSIGTLFPLDEKAIGETWQKSEYVRIEKTPAYLLIITRGNSRVSQVKAGMLYSRIHLTATAAGLTMQPVSQVLQEFSEMNDLYREVHRLFADNGQTIQMLVRVGEPAKEVMHSPRLDVMEIIE